MEVEKKEVIDPESATGDMFSEPDLTLKLKTVKTSHWFDIKEGQAIQALIAHADGEKRLYVVTVPMPPEYSWIEHDRWPKIMNTNKH